MKSSRVMAMALWFMALLAGCSGGGGGDSGLSVSTATKKIELTYNQDESVSTTINISARGETDGDIYVGSVDAARAFNRVDISITSTSSAVAVVYPRADLPIGTHRGELQLLACKDTACNSHYAGSPIKIPYVLNVKRGLQIVGDRSMVVATAGQSPAARQYTVTPPDGVSSMQVEVVGGPWLKAQWSAPSLELTFERMPAGIHRAEVRFTGNSRQTIGSFTIDYQVQASGNYNMTLAALPQSLLLVAQEGESESAMVTVTIPTWADGWTVEANDSDVPWLTFRKQQDNQLQVTADASALDKGQYLTMLRLTSTGQQPSTISLPVTFHVSSGYAVSLAESFQVSNGSTPTSLRRNIPITHAANRQRNWQATTTSDWLVLERANGLTSVDAIELRVDAAKVVAAAAYSEVYGTIELSVDGGKEHFSIQITAAHLMAELSHVMPAALVEGQAATMLIGGKNLDLIDLGTLLNISGGSNTSVKRLSAELLEVGTEATAAGVIQLTLGNNLGLPESVVTVPVHQINPSLSFRKVASTGVGTKRPPFYDGQRAQFWIVDTQNGQLHRYQQGSVQWQETSIAFMNLIDAVMTPDNKHVAVMTRDKIVLLDPDTLQERKTFNSSAVNGTTYYEQFFAPRPGAKALIAMPDNTLRLTFGSDQWTDAYQLNLATDVFIPFGQYGTTFYNGPTYAVSANGRSALLQQAWGISGTYPQLALSAVDGSVQDTVLEGMSYFSNGSFSENAERVLLDCRNVYDERFAFVGSLPNQYDDGRTAMGCAITADGSRLYVITARYGSYWPYTVDRNYPTRVYVYGTSRVDMSSLLLPKLGHFELADFLGPESSDFYSGAGYASVPMVLDQGGQHLLMAGYQGTVIIPVPALQTVAGKSAAGHQGMVLWRRVQQR